MSSVCNFPVHRLLKQGTGLLPRKDSCLRLNMLKIKRISGLPEGPRTGRTPSCGARETEEYVQLRRAEVPREGFT